MKTDTRARIQQLIEKNGRMRPFELQKALTISAQAIHRHLRALSENGIIEVQGSAPFTRYRLAGSPEFDDAFKWARARTAPKGFETLVCETREIFSARLPRLKSFVKQGLPENLLPLVVSTAGEIGNNSFDHNLGQWQDIPGCWFEPQVSGRHLWICIADRGQGIYQSLVKMHPKLKDEETALHAAFETIISGRAPEQRGNGLKFVKTTILQTPGAGIACLSGSSRAFYGEQGPRCADFLNRNVTIVQGTITLMIWQLYEDRS